MLLFVVDWRVIVEGRVTLMGIVPALDVAEDDSKLYRLNNSHLRVGLIKPRQTTVAACRAWLVTCPLKARRAEGQSSTATDLA